MMTDHPRRTVGLHRFVGTDKTKPKEQARTTNAVPTVMRVIVAERLAREFRRSPELGPLVESWALYYLRSSDPVSTDKPRHDSVYSGR